MRISTTFKAIVLAACCVAGGSHAATELISNGSFEQNVQTLNTWDIYNNLFGWHGGDHGIELRNNVAGSAFDGKNFVELDTTANSSMSQVIHTNAGQHYTLSFAFADRAGVAAASEGVQVKWGDLNLGTFNNASQWTTKKFDVVGNLGNTRLSFIAKGISDSYGTSIDKVSVTSAVPEPETYAMLLLGLGLVGYMARRKRA